MRLRSDVHAAALMRAATAAGGFAAVRVHGHEEGGILHLLYRSRQDLRLFVERHGPDAPGGFALAARFSGDAEADAWIIRALNFDPDLWVIELEGDALATLLPALQSGDGAA